VALNTQTKANSTKSEQNVPEVMHVMVKLVEIARGGDGGGSLFSAHSWKEKMVRMRTEVSIEVLSSDTLSSFQHKISEQFDKRIPPPLQRVIVGGCLLPADVGGRLSCGDGAGSEVGGMEGGGAGAMSAMTLCDCHIMQHSLVHVLIPAGILKEETEEEEQVLVGEMGKCTERVRILENVLEKAEISASKLEHLQLLLPSYWLLAQVCHMCVCVCLCLYLCLCL